MGFDEVHENAFDVPRDDPRAKACLGFRPSMRSHGSPEAPKWLRHDAGMTALGGLAAEKKIWHCFQPALTLTFERQEKKNAPPGELRRKLA